MAATQDAWWQGSLTAPYSRERRSGTYHPYVPDGLADRPAWANAALADRAAEVERAVLTLAGSSAAHSLDGVARFLLRSEAVASSRIEGLQVSPQQLALAELAQDDDLHVRGFTENARLVANNITALRRASTDLVRSPSITIESIDDVHHALLPAHQPAGLRTIQNWIGGSPWHPLDAEFVPPPPELVVGLMADLVGYLNGAADAPLIQAALVHAQFETIHPFTDGNGRVGRALVHTVLTRRGLTRSAVLPISVVLLTRSQAYVEGLTAYRYDGPSDRAEAVEGVHRWLHTFLDAVVVAVDQARRIASELDELRMVWEARHQALRRSEGLRETPRADSAVTRLRTSLTEVPIVTARTAERLLDVSFPAARHACEELARAGILSPKKVDRGTTGYLARDVFDLVTYAERALVSTQWDTRESPPSRPAPAQPRP